MPLFGTTLTLASNASAYNLLAVLQSGTIAGHLPAGMNQQHSFTCRELTFTWVLGTVNIGDSKVTAADQGKALSTNDRVLTLRSSNINCISLADIWLIPTANGDKVDVFCLYL